MSKAKRTPQGGIQSPAFLTRVGVFEYRNPDGSTRRELRPPEEVFAEDSLATLEGAPVTYLHPTTPVRPDNYRTLSRGHATQPRADGDYVAATVMVQDAEVIGLVDAGAVSEVSLGYRTRLDMTPGEHPQWGRYDAIQRDITYNHVALGPKNWGRAGNDVALRLDSQGHQTLPVPEIPERQEKMKTIRIDGTDYEYGSEAHLAKIEADAAHRLTEVQARADAAEARADAAERERDALRADTSTERLDAMVQERLDLIDRARTVLGTGADLRGQADREIMISAIRKDESDFVEAGKSDDYVRAYFDALCKRVASRADSTVDAVRRAVAGAPAAVRNDGQDKGRRTVEQARQEMLEHNHSLAAQPLRFSNLPRN